MKDCHNRAHSMDRSSSRHRGGYDKEMDHAFTLIFHNIKRLKDGQLSNSVSVLACHDSNASLSSPGESLQLPLRRDLSYSDPSINVPQENKAKLRGTTNLSRLKSRSFSGAPVSPQTQRRRVRFSDDSMTAEPPKRQTLERRPFSAHTRPQVPIIVLTKENWQLPLFCPRGAIKIKSETYGPLQIGQGDLINIQSIFSNR